MSSWNSKKSDGAIISEYDAWGRNSKQEFAASAIAI